VRRFVLGDVHGNIKALQQVIERAPVDKQNDHLIFIGDICDGHPYTYECVEELLTFSNLVAIKGNHDHWCENWMTQGVAPYIWVSQGGKATIESYNNHGGVNERHVKYFRDTIYYYITEDNKLFVHGGYDPNKLFVDAETQMEMFRVNDYKDYMWDRYHAMCILKGYVGDIPEIPFDEMYIGHTSTLTANITTPVFHKGIHLIDTGAGGNGPLTLMDVDTKEYWQSDRIEGGR